MKAPDIRTGDERDLVVRVRIVDTNGCNAAGRLFTGLVLGIPVTLTEYEWEAGRFDAKK